MPIMFIHGVAVRSDPNTYAQQIEARFPFLRRYLAPIISTDPDHVPLIPVYWGDLGASLAWNGLSRPRTPLRGQGAIPQLSDVEQLLTMAQLQDVIKELPQRLQAATTLSPAGGLSSGGGATPAQATLMPRLKDLRPNQLSDLLVILLQRAVPNDPAQQTQAAIIADDVAHNPDTLIQLARCANIQDRELVVIEALLVKQYAKAMAGAPVLAGMGVPEWLQAASDNLRELVVRNVDGAGYMLTRMAVEFWRKQLNEQIVLFLGDIFMYLTNRGSAEVPGEISKRVMGKFREARAAQKQRNDEPLVVITHSMGGQIVYDMVTHFLPRTADTADVRVDFWCATASQIGLFEEMKLFRASNPAYSAASGKRAPFPDSRYLGGWWNVWDHNDVLSFTSKDIFDGRIMDESYDAGMFIAEAHGGYLEQPSFYRLLADKLTFAKSANWYRP